MTNDEAVFRLAQCDRTVKVQKLAKSTLLVDCQDQLWQFLGRERPPVGTVGEKKLRVADLGHDVWTCQLPIGRGIGVGYGTTFAAAVAAASSNVRAKAPAEGASP